MRVAGWLLGAVCLWGTAWPGGAAAQGAGVREALADLRLATAVRLALATDPATRAFDVGVWARDGIVRLEPLRGTLPPAARDVARRVPGVRVLAEDDTPPAQGVSAPSPRAPAEPDEMPAVGALYHTVAPGETLFRIAQRYETTVEAIMALNRLAAPGIRAGQRLRVR